jgi:hypothetical protein
MEKLPPTYFDADHNFQKFSPGTYEKSQAISATQMVELQKNSHIRRIDGESRRFIIE